MRLLMPLFHEPLALMTISPVLEPDAERAPVTVKGVVPKVRLLVRFTVAPPWKGSEPRVRRPALALPLARMPPVLGPTVTLPTVPVPLRTPWVTVIEGVDA